MQFGIIQRMMFMPNYSKNDIILVRYPSVLRNENPTYSYIVLDIKYNLNYKNHQLDRASLAFRA
jgi:hypothetical protein